ncbi:MAG TPA: DUF4105 domain-containing protein [Prolixibacteraceae bacterium]|nr:DUF4105 domain-containing protein [Prolixibacteraceae bacterium]
MLQKLLGRLFAALFIVWISSVKVFPQENRVILFTCGPGAELYAGFGHSALWIYNPTKGIDRLYNYGTFDFNTPHFYTRFIRGKLDYMLSVTTARSFLNEYNARNIEVNGQTLDLTDEEALRLFQFLENNLLPENRFYKYDFFFDNCATRIRDVVATACGDTVVFCVPDENLSFREMLFPYMEHTPWTKFGVNLILGLTADRKATPWEYSFLPEYMDDAFRTATIGTEGKERSLVRSEKAYLPCRLEFSNKKADDPVVVFSFLLLLAVALTLAEQKYGKSFVWIDRILFPLSALAGLFLFFMWVGTDHTATRYNLNMLWLFPAQFALIVSWFLTSKGRLLLPFLGGIWQVLVSVLMFFWPQESELSFLLLSLIFLTRLLASLRNIVQKNGLVKNAKAI